MIKQIRRRRFTSGLLTALVGSLAAFCLPIRSDAQQPVSPRLVGVLLVEFSSESREPQAFRQGLREMGYTEGRDVLIEWRSAEGDYARIPGLATDLVERKVDVIVVDSTPGAQAAKRATSTIPIVMAVVGDPVGSGLVSTLARPTGNITGLSVLAAELSAKRLELLKEAVPRLTRVAVLWNPDTQWHAKAVENLRSVAPSLSIKLNLVSVRTPDEFGSAFAAVRRAHAQALYVLPAALFGIHGKTLVELASKARLPDIYGDRHYTDEGGLMSYGPNYSDHWRRSAGYVDKVLKGAQPSDLPIQQASKFELVVNLRTAQALGLGIPEAVLQKADEVIK
jgi:putative ABC transport system substrate-binding protein